MIVFYPFGSALGQTVYAYRLSVPKGLCATVLTFGATLQSLLVSTPAGPVDVVCGYDGMDGYLYAGGYQGSTVGRFANRIARAAFDLGGKTYRLFANDGRNHLHGGKTGFSHRIWDAVPEDGEEPALRLSLHSPDSEEGYPGNLDVEVIYRLTREGGLSLSYRASTDADTYLNLTNHSYFNLGGFASGSVLEHVLWVDADRYCVPDGELIPTGELRPVDGTPFDFRTAKPLGRDFQKTGGGYDHCLVFADREGGLRRRIVLSNPANGLCLSVLTDQPAVQVYSANFMNDPIPFKGGYPQQFQHAVALETQHMPDSMHHPGFTDCLLRAGAVFSSRTEYRFSQTETKG